MTRALKSADRVTMDGIHFTYSVTDNDGCGAIWKERRTIHKDRDPLSLDCVVTNCPKCGKPVALAGNVS